MTAAAIAGVALSAAGAATSFAGAGKAASAQKAMSGVQIQQENVRERAMEFDARRRTLEVLRNQQRARALALTTATAQGASMGSGLMGGYGQIAGQAGENITGIQGQLGFGREMFALNRQMAGIQNQYASASSMMSMGSGMSSLGGAILSNLGPIKSIGAGFGPGASYSGFKSGLSAGKM